MGTTNHYDVAPAEFRSVMDVRELKGCEMDAGTAFAQISDDVKRDCLVGGTMALSFGGCFPRSLRLRIKAPGHVMLMVVLNGGDTYDVVVAALRNLQWVIENDVRDVGCEELSEVVRSVCAEHQK